MPAGAATSGDFDSPTSVRREYRRKGRLGEGLLGGRREASRAEVSLVGERIFGLAAVDFCFLEGLLVCAMGLLVVDAGVVGSC